MSLRIRKRFSIGYTPIVDRPTQGIELLRFGVVRLEAGGRWNQEAEPNRETALIVLSGNCDIISNEDRWRDLNREDVFSRPATGLYLPPGRPYEIVTNDPVEIAVITAPAETGGPATLVRPEDVQVSHRGRESWERDVHFIMTDNVDAERLLVAETFNQPGKWSSFPPHKHDEHRPPQEVKLEEFYFYKVKPEHGFGFQGVYTQDGDLDEAYMVENNDTILFPRGYHPTVAAPGYTLYYLWSLVGPERVMQIYEDPDHTWVVEQD
ncbi:MAG: 5-deoxy-glucuronate isomerase [Candidatus Bipolaricaulia bacterium]